MPNTNKSLTVLLTCVLIIIGVLIILISTPKQTNAQNPLQWEYLIAHYYQGNDSSLPSNDNNIYEMVTTGYGDYDDLLAEGWQGSCTLSRDSADIACLHNNFKGREFYINFFGDDGWELFQVDNLSTQYSYSLDLFFKRLKQ
jgi:hypothetical protein